jgi:hypothetical protein
MTRRWVPAYAGTTLRLVGMTRRVGEAFRLSKWIPALRQAQGKLFAGMTWYRAGMTRQGARMAR